MQQLAKSYRIPITAVQLMGVKAYGVDLESHYKNLPSLGTPITL